jgi:hypothetical protein
VAAKVSGGQQFISGFIEWNSKFRIVTSKRISGRCGDHKKGRSIAASAFKKELAATYSRGVYKTTTIGKTVFDGRVRNGNGSDHSFMATKNLSACPPSRNPATAGVELNQPRKY